MITRNIGVMLSERGRVSSNGLVPGSVRTGLYSKFKEDETFRKKVAEQIGIGSELPIEKPELAPQGLLSHVT